MSVSVSAESTSGVLEWSHHGNVCVVLLVGIPGSGKSHFRLFLENYFKNNSKSKLGPTKVFSVSYDDFIKVKNPNQFSDSFRWKEDRLKILKIIEKIIGNLKNYVPQDHYTTFEHIRVINSEIRNPDTVLFIIDDNMYYRSMRYEYYKLSRSYNLAFCQIFFNAKKEDALKFNEKREPQSQVPQFVIEKMSEKLEPPDKNLTWEANTLTLIPYLNLEQDRVIKSIFSLFESALKCPVQENLNSLEKEEAQKINISNAIHQIDIVLKKLVGDLIKQKIKDSSVNPCTISLYLSEQRLEILKKIKDRQLALPVNLSEPISKQDIEVIKPILLEYLNSISAF